MRQQVRAHLRGSSVLRQRKILRHNEPVFIYCFVANTLFIPCDSTSCLHLWINGWFFKWNPWRLQRVSCIWRQQYPFLLTVHLQHCQITYWRKYTSAWMLYSSHGCLLESSWATRRSTRFVSQRKHNSSRKQERKPSLVVFYWTVLQVTNGFHWNQDRVPQSKWDNLKLRIPLEYRKHVLAEKQSAMSLLLGHDPEMNKPW